MNEPREGHSSEPMKCPKCGGDMEIGYLRDAPFWRRGTKMLKFGFGPRVFAYKCRNCGFVELYVENKGKREEPRVEDAERKEGESKKALTRREGQPPSVPSRERGYV